MAYFVIPKSLKILKTNTIWYQEVIEVEEVEWKLELEEFEFAGCMDNHTGMGSLI